MCCVLHYTGGTPKVTLQRVEAHNGPKMAPLVPPRWPTTACLIPPAYCRPRRDSRSAIFCINCAYYGVFSLHFQYCSLLFVIFFIFYILSYKFIIYFLDFFFPFLYHPISNLVVSQYSRRGLRNLRSGPPQAEHF